MPEFITVRDGSIIVPMCNTFVTGSVRWIVCVTIGPDYLPWLVREAMLDLRIRTVFSDRDLKRHMFFPLGSRIALTEDMVEAMRQAGKSEAANLLQKEISGPREVFGFPSWTYKPDPPLRIC